MVTPLSIGELQINHFGTCIWGRLLVQVRNLVFILLFGISYISTLFMNLPTDWDSLIIYYWLDYNTIVEAPL